MPEKLQEITKVAKVGTVSIDLYANGEIIVRDFPNEANAAVSIMHRATISVAMHFIQMAAAGKITKEPQRIIRPNGVNPESLKVVH